MLVTTEDDSHNYPEALSLIYSHNHEEFSALMLPKAELDSSDQRPSSQAKAFIA